MNRFAEIKPYKHKMLQYTFFFLLSGNLHVLLIKVKSKKFTETK